MVDAPAIASHLGADDAGRVGLLRRAADPADPLSVDNLDVERADGRTIVRTDRGAPLNVASRVHPASGRAAGWSASRGLSPDSEFAPAAASRQRQWPHIDLRSTCESTRRS